MHVALRDVQLIDQHPAGCPVVALLVVVRHARSSTPEQVAALPGKVTVRQQAIPRPGGRTAGQDQGGGTALITRLQQPLPDQIQRRSGNVVTSYDGWRHKAS